MGLWAPHGAGAESRAGGADLEARLKAMSSAACGNCQKAQVARVEFWSIKRLPPSWFLIYQDAPAQLFEGYIYLYQLFKNHLASNLKTTNVVLISGYFFLRHENKISIGISYKSSVICITKCEPLWEHRSESPDWGVLNLLGLRQHLEKNGNLWELLGRALWALAYILTCGIYVLSLKRVGHEALPRPLSG